MTIYIIAGALIYLFIGWVCAKFLIRAIDEKVSLGDAVFFTLAWPPALALILIITFCLGIGWLFSLAGGGSLLRRIYGLD